MTTFRFFALGLLSLALAACDDPRAAEKQAAVKREIAFAKSEVAALELEISSLKGDIELYQKHASRPESPEYAVVVPDARTKWMDARDKLLEAERRRDDLSRSIHRRELELEGVR